jgi:hypothetical protein
MTSKFFKALKKYTNMFDHCKFDIKVVPSLDNDRFALIYEKETDDLFILQERENGKVREMYLQTEVVQELRKML